MIKLFRNIRKKLVAEGKTANYLKYAIGEIVLVVIGILIALQINNWNENRKLQKEELIVLSDIKNNLQTMLVSFSADTLSNSSDIVQYEKIENYIANDLPYSNELDSVFGILTFWNNTYITATAYNSLQSKGLDLIKNETLKKDIADMYESNLKKLTEDYQQGESQLNTIIVEPFLIKHVKRLKNKSLRVARPNDFESLKKNQEFSNILSNLIRQRKRGIEMYSEVMTKMQILVDKINYEIGLRKE